MAQSNISSISFRSASYDFSSMHSIMHIDLVHFITLLAIFSTVTCKFNLVKSRNILYYLLHIHI